MAIAETQVVASECCAALYPQNTLSGFKYCLAAGVDGIEFDVHLSQDGQVVVQHDARLNRHITRNAEGVWLSEVSNERPAALCDLTLNQIREYDVGRYAAQSRPAKDYSNYTPVDGERIPTLEEFLKAYTKADSQATLWIELKTTPFDRATTSAPDKLLEAVLALVKKYNVVHNTVLLAFEWQLLLDAKAACPDIGTDFLSINPEFIKRLYRDTKEVDPNDMYKPLILKAFNNSFPKTIASASGDWWGPWVGDVKKVDIIEAQACGLLVNVWGVDSNEPAIDAALELGANALTISDSKMLQLRMLELENLS